MKLKLQERQCCLRTEFSDWKNTSEKLALRHKDSDEWVMDKHLLIHDMLLFRLFNFFLNKRVECATQIQLTWRLSYNLLKQVWDSSAPSALTHFFKTHFQVYVGQKKISLMQRTTHTLYVYTGKNPCLSNWDRLAHILC